MSASAPTLSLVLHSHLPWVLHHGRWPHGSDWLCEAAAESYLPLWRVLSSRARPGRSLGVTLGLTPVLCEQLAHPDFVPEFRDYLRMKYEAAREDRARFRTENRAAEWAQAGEWEQFYRDTLEDFFGVAGTNLVARFRALEERGAIEIVTSAATHGYLPLLGTAASVERQVAVARRAHRRHFGREPRGMWLPECAYRPEGVWFSPLHDGRFESRRAGLEQVLAAHGLRWFCVDRHLISGGRPMNVYLDSAGAFEQRAADHEWTATGLEPLGPYAVGRTRVTCLGRDESTAQQVWSREAGYPGDPAYLEFHKRRDPGGLRYWRVTEAHADLGAKGLYDRASALRRVPEQAGHFLDVVARTLGTRGGRVPHVCAMYDTELFGHWWHEGPEFLGAVLDGAIERGITLATGGDVATGTPVRGRLSLPEGSWGAGGMHGVWLQPETEPMWRRVHETEVRFERLVARVRALPRDAWGTRLMAQAARELMLLEASDWTFLVTNGTARDYALARTTEHADAAKRLMDLAEEHASGALLTGRDATFVTGCERRDSLFPELGNDAEWFTRVIANDEALARP